MNEPSPFHLPRPRLTLEQATDLARDRFGITGTVTELGSHQDRNFRIETDAGAVVLKVANPAVATVELEAQNAALQHLVGLNLDLPAPVAGIEGSRIVHATIDGQNLDLRLLTYVDGHPLTESARLSVGQIRSLGDVAARLVHGLADFEHPGTDRFLQWDLRRGGAVIDALLPAVDDEARRVRLRTVTDTARQRIALVADDLRVQTIHGDLTDDNVVSRDGAAGTITGVIDFGDVARGWLVAELAATCACVLYRSPQHPLAILDTIEAFAARVALTEAELGALWPLILVRTAVLVVSGEAQVQLDGDNDYADANRAREWLAFETAAAQNSAELEALIRFTVADQAVAEQRQPIGATEHPLLGPLDPEARIDLSVTSAAFDAGSWLEPGIDERVATDAAARLGLAVTGYGEFRLSQTKIDTADESITLHLGVGVYLPEGSPVTAPIDGTVVVVDSTTVRLDGADYDLWLTGVAATALDGEVIRAGAALGSVTAHSRRARHETAIAGVMVQTSRLRGIRPPRFVAPSTAALWQRVCPDPSALLGLTPLRSLADPAVLLQRRDASFARVQEHYYAAPPQIERGWKHHLIDTHGQSYVDMVNNVTTVGHGHPRITEAARSQWSLLNTNSRFHYEELVRFTERLAELAPDPLDTVFLVNSGTEAVDLALRLALSYTGHDTVLSVREAYHGWSMAADAVSSSVADNPRALETRPDWVHLVEAPNAVRGKYRGMQSAPQYLNDLDGDLQALSAEGRTVAAFIAEPVFGNAGGVLLPDGYLSGVYERMRARGALCIADEVQVSYARLGRHFWGTEQQNVVPDIITIAKAMGNGHPLGAVITRRDVAERFADDGPFFSSAGGSPLSCRIGLTVLDIMRDEGLQQNAEVVGRHLKRGLERLGERFDSVGAVYGMGLYLGVELVSDRAKFTPATALAARLCDELLLRGCIVQPTGDFKNVLKIKPPLCLSIASADHFLRALDGALSELCA
ncbi:aminotransferase [Cryobacterium luteum]|uniref:Aminotransferase n=1 Tax=Cryobacterium luteum TaxID=1424661 RepID=A0A1H8KTI1_9MICO|nr:aminotransferase [Cryobacterium luteum]TFB87797.1 aminotransferase [Cryobacterium luteum]SEN96220.1 hydroxylysine kinase /5-phosphonooxy-L-lysine phospho-lyase apoenzyme [Cryobacterium luteum]